MCAASAQRVGGAFAAVSIGLTFSISVLLNRSAIPFCSGVYGVEKDCLISQLEHILLNVELVYSDNVRGETKSFHCCQNGDEGRIQI